MDIKVALERENTELKLELEKAKAELVRLRKEKEESAFESQDTAEALRRVSHGCALPSEKKGYLFQWQDRSIGWGGTKWNLLFVCHELGRLSIYQSHMDEAPISVVTLRNCEVQDEGRKRNRRHKSNEAEPPSNEVGAYFHVFGIYHRESDDLEDEMSSSSRRYANSASLLLHRFSTRSVAEKLQWMDIISQACAYCETEQFVANEAAREAEKMRQQEEQARMAMLMPGASKGTLPPLYFAPAVTDFKKLKRRPSMTRIPRSESFRTISELKDADAQEATRGFYPPSKPLHIKAAPSFLSSEAPVQNYRGLFNLAIILLIVSNFRLIVDTMQLHGVALLRTEFSFDSLKREMTERPWHDHPFLAAFVVLQLFLVSSFFIEWNLSRNKISESLGMALHNVNTHGTLLQAVRIVWYQIDNPFVGAVLLFHATITWMKLISYVCANEDYRLAVKAGNRSSIAASLTLLSNLEQEDEHITYPSNVTLGNLYYFLCAPTLTYQIAFPKTPRVRMRRVIGILAGLFTCGVLATFLVSQVVSPALRSLVIDLEKTNGVYTVGIMANYWLKLAIANTYLWLLMFYTYFHLYLNLWAELLRFGDRVFYKDWWNSSDVASYWRLWNMPVHLWLVRHLYFPTIRLNFSKSAAMFLVFTLSAVMHELLVSVPFHIIRPWSFLGMMMQIPLVVITKALYQRNPGSSIGNIIFWLTFCIFGQPMAILMYTADYQYAKHNAAIRAS